MVIYSNKLVKVPDVINLSYSDACSKLSSVDLRYNHQNNPDSLYIIDQSPEEGTIVYKKTEVVLSTESISENPNHIQAVREEAQKNGLALIVDRIADINPEGFPMVLTGDFNVTPDDPVLDDLETKMLSARDNASQTDSLGTFNGWGGSDSVIDYIWYDGFASCDKFETVRIRYGGIPYISDHYPVHATLTF